MLSRYYYVPRSTDTSLVTPPALPDIGDREVVMTASFDLDRPLRLHPLTFLEEGEEVTVGRADIDSYRHGARRRPAWESDRGSRSTRPPAGSGCISR
ncbi:MAG TPA: hypothetical protein VGD84_24225 [Pseudonocardiaceae bacterium]